MVLSVVTEAGIVVTGARTMNECQKCNNNGIHLYSQEGMSWDRRGR